MAGREAGRNVAPVSRRQVFGAGALAAVVTLVGACGSGGRSAARSSTATTGALPAPASRATSSTSAGSSLRPTAAPPTSVVASPTPAQPCGVGAGPPPVYDHVVWIWMENHTYSQVIDNGRAPYASSLAHQCGTVTRYSTVGSPSLPNYVGATSGSTQGITDDAAPSAHPVATDNLFRQVRAAGGTERSYEESMPGPCALASSGRYAVKHNPAAYYVGPTDRQACVADNLPLGGAQGGALAADLASGSLPSFSFVTPDLCNDSHDCSVGTGDAWLQQWLPRIFASPAYKSGRTAIFVVWDEYTPVPNIVISPTTAPGSVSAVAVDHYSLLRTTEEMLGIPSHLGRAGAAPSLRAAFHL